MGPAEFLRTVCSRTIGSFLKNRFHGDPPTNPEVEGGAPISASDKPSPPTVMLQKPPKQGERKEERGGLVTCLHPSTAPPIFILHIQEDPPGFLTTSAQEAFSLDFESPTKTLCGEDRRHAKEGELPHAVSAALKRKKKKKKKDVKKKK